MATQNSTQTTLNSLLATLAGLLGPLSPFTKAIVGPATGLITALVNLAITGSFNATSIITAAGGLVIGLVTFLLPNLAKKG